MSIEKLLVEEFERDSRMCPSDLDIRMAAEYRQRVMQQRGEPSMFNKRKMPKFVLFAAVFILICGFGYAGGKLLFDEHTEKLSSNYRTEQQLQLAPEEVANIRSSLAEVKAQLNPGETAVVYFKDHDFEVQGSPVVFGINNPVALPLEAWRVTLQQHNVGEKLPESILGTYNFVGGMETSPYQFSFGGNAYTLLDEMRAESKKTGSGMLWRKADASDDLIGTYTSVYRNVANDSIYLTWQIAEGAPGAKMMQLVPPNTVYEDVQLGSLTGHYLKDGQSLFGQSSVHQDVTWLSESEGKTVSYHVQTDSTAMTKEQLIEAARSLF
ncbi:hypothetical protein [Paenibacillus graminis]|uniref:hypothetical protein n=1 Tax=Paenibacillus graminis TaxID=189425 RepID=UPI002DB79D15|nr:hypothetical protein [Paenibacillus graminis]MEC0168309.1 hypothetical protein [Paenibacillus graminis]